MFIRFVTATYREDSWQATGVFASLRLLDGRLEKHETKLVEETCDWFNAKLPCPPFERNLADGWWTPQAVAWYQSHAQEMISRMWDLVAIMREHGIVVQILRTETPGRIVYRDAYQVVAETPRRRRRRHAQANWLRADSGCRR